MEHPNQGQAVSLHIKRLKRNDMGTLTYVTEVPVELKSEVVFHHKRDKSPYHLSFNMRHKQDRVQNVVCK